MADITFYKDANKTLQITYRDSNDAVVNLTSYTASAKFYDKSGNLNLTLSSGSGITLGSTAPNISIAFTINQINALPNSGLLKLTITTGGVTERLITENFTVLP